MNASRRTVAVVLALSLLCASASVLAAPIVTWTVAEETHRWADAIGANGVNHSAAPPTDKWSEEWEFETSGIRRCKAKYGLLNAMDHSVQDGNVTIGPRPAITIDWPSFLRLVAALERCGSQ